MTRRCSHCGHNGHNSRTCPNRGVKLFGVRLDGGGSIRKCASMGNLSHYAGGSGGGASPAVGDGDEREKDGYASEDFAKGSSSSYLERKKGVAWTEEEHKKFLLGLQKLGKGNWKDISRQFVGSRTATQVASHAQKYFIRQANASRRKRRSSLFDLVPDEHNDSQEAEEHEHEPPNSNPSNLLALPPHPPSSPLTLPPHPPSNPLTLPPHPPPPETVQYNYPVTVPHPPPPEALQYNYPVVYPPYPPFVPIFYPVWPQYTTASILSNPPSIVRPAAVHSTTPINLEELGGMSKLSLGEAGGSAVNGSLQPNFRGGLERHSAFHVNNPATTGSRIDSSSSPIHAV